MNRKRSKILWGGDKPGRAAVLGDHCLRGFGCDSHKDFAPGRESLHEKIEEKCHK